MAITNASRLADFSSGIGTGGAILQVDNANKEVGIGTTNPNATLTVNYSGIAGTSLFVHGDARITGVLTATSFSGSASVTGINTSGFSIFNQVKNTGITTVSNATASTSTTTGALIVSGGVGIAKSLFVGEGISVGGTITYDDVTNIDSVGIVTAGKGLRSTTGGLIVSAGVATFAAAIDANGALDVDGATTLDGLTVAEAAVFSANVKVSGIATIGAGVTISSDFIHLADNSKINVGAGSDFQLYHDSTNNHSYIKESGGGSLIVLADDLYIQAVDTATMIKAVDDGEVELYHNGTAKFTTTADGVDVTSTGSIKVPVGTTAQRNGSPTAGDFRYNSTEGKFEGYTSSWGEIGGGGGGLSTSAYTASGITTYLKLGDAQDHKLTATGVTTVSCYGGTESESHTLRIVNSGIATVGFSTYFLWPGGSAPDLPTASGAISLISFTVQRVGAAGTQLLSGASLNYSY